MTVSCSCDFDGGILAVGDREVTCRTPRDCYACEGQIKISDRMYMYSMFDYDVMKPSTPIFLCEECGDLAETLTEYGFCYNLGENIRNQWFDYLSDNDPNNIALIGTRWEKKHNQ